MTMRAQEPGGAKGGPFHGVVERFLVLSGVLMGLLVVAQLGMITIVDPWPWWERRVPSETITACVAEMSASDQRLRLHGRDVFVHIARECPAVADLLAPSIARFLHDDDLRVRATTVEALGTLGRAAGPFEPAISALRGSSVPNLDYTIAIALAHIRQDGPATTDGGAYCSMLTRAAVENALNAQMRLSWSWDTVDKSQCAYAPRRTEP
jgi:hypothetical protein